MKVRNKRIYSDDQEYLERIAEEYGSEWIGYRVKLSKGCLTVYALPPKRGKREKQKKLQHRSRGIESFDRPKA